MASVNSTEILNGILNCVTRIEKAVGGGGAGGGGGDKGGSRSGLKARISDIKDMGQNVADIATGLIKLHRARRGLNTFNSFLDTVVRHAKAIDGPLMSSSIRNVAMFIAAVGNLNMKNVTAFKLFMSTLQSSNGKDGKSPLEAVGCAMNAWGGKGVSPGTKNFGRFIDVITKGISAKNIFSLGMFILLSKPLATALKSIARGIARWSTPGVKRGERAIKKFIKTLGNFSVAIALFALTIVASSMALAATGIKLGGGMGVVAGAIGGIALATMLFAIPLVRRGTRGISNLGKGILALSVGVAIFALTIAMSSKMLKDSGVGGPLIATAGVVGAIGAMALAVAVFGIKPVRDGANSLKSIGVGFIAMAAGVAVLGLAFCLISNMAGENFAKTTLMMILAVAGIGAMMIVLGKNVKNIAMGALAMVAMSLGLGIFGAALGFTAALMPRKGDKPDWEMLGFIAASIAAIGVEFGVIGVPVVAGFIAIGAATTLLMGGALYALGEGIHSWNEAKTGDFDTEKFKSITKSLRESYSDFGLLEAGKITVASAAVAAIGLSLSSLAWGVGKWANLQNIPLVTGYDENGKPIFGSEKVSIETAIQNIGAVLSVDSPTSVIKPFKDLAESGVVSRQDRGGLGGLLGMQADSPFEVGIKASMGIGFVLSSVAKGIGAFANLQNIPLAVGFDKNGNPIFGSEKVDISKAIQNIKDVFGTGEGSFSILTPFTDFATNNPALSRGGRGISLLGAIGIQADSPFEVGIKAASGIGEVLTSIAEGITAFANLQSIPLLDHFDSKGKPVYKGKADIVEAIKNIRAVLDSGKGKYSILTPFSDFANNTPSLDRGGRGLSLLGAIGIQADSPFEVGVKAATGIGEVLTSIAEGITAFANLQSIPLISGYDSSGKPIYNGKFASVPAAIDNVKKILGLTGEYSLLNIFSDFAKNTPSLKKDSRGGLLGLVGIKSDSLFELGIQAAIGIGDVLTGIGGGLKTFADLQNTFIIDHYDDAGKPVYSNSKLDVNAAIKNIDTLIKTIANTFSTHGKSLSEAITEFEDETGKSIGESITDICAGATSHAKEIVELDAKQYYVNMHLIAASIERIDGVVTNKRAWETPEFNRTNIYDNMRRITRDYLSLTPLLDAFNPKFNDFANRLNYANESVKNFDTTALMGLTSALRSFMNSFDGNEGGIAAPEEKKGFFAKAASKIKDFFTSDKSKKAATTATWKPGQRFAFITDTLYKLSISSKGIGNAATSVTRLGKGMNDLVSAINLVSDSKWQILRDLSVSLSEAAEPEKIASIIESLSSLTSAINGTAQTSSETASTAKAAVSVENTSSEVAETTKPAAQKSSAKKDGNAAQSLNTELVAEIKSLKSELSSIKKALTNNVLTVKTVSGSEVRINN